MVEHLNILLFAGESPPPKKPRVDNGDEKTLVDEQIDNFPMLLSPGENKCNPQGAEEELATRNLTEFQDHVEKMCAT